MIREYPKIDNFFITDKKLYITDGELNYLGSIDKGSDIVNLEHLFENEEDFEETPWLFGGIISVEDKLFLIPLTASKLYILDTKTKRVEAIEIPFTENSKTSVKVKFQQAFLSGESIFMIPGVYPGIVEYNYRTHSFAFYDDWVETLKQNARDEETAFFSITKEYGGIIYAPACGSDRILKFSMIDRTWEIVTVDADNKGFCAICKDDSFFWLLPRKGNRITCWNEKNGDVEYITGFWGEEVYLGGIEYWNKKIWIVPRSRNNIGVIDSEEKIEDLKLAGNNFKIARYGKNMYISSFEDGKIYEFTDNGIFEHSLQFDQKIKDYYDNYFSEISAFFNGRTENCIFRENKVNKLSYFIKGICSDG